MIYTCSKRDLLRIFFLIVQREAVSVPLDFSFVGRCLYNGNSKLRFRKSTEVCRSLYLLYKARNESVICSTEGTYLTLARVSHLSLQPPFSLAQLSPLQMQDTQPLCPRDSCYWHSRLGTDDSSPNIPLLSADPTQ